MGIQEGRMPASSAWQGVPGSLTGLTSCPKGWLHRQQQLEPWANKGRGGQDSQTGRDVTAFSKLWVWDRPGAPRGDTEIQYYCTFRGSLHVNSWGDNQAWAVHPMEYYSAMKRNAHKTGRQTTDHRVKEARHKGPHCTMAFICNVQKKQIQRLTEHVRGCVGWGWELGWTLKDKRDPWADREVLKLGRGDGCTTW